MKIGKHRSGSWIECLKCHCRPFPFFTDSIGHVGVEWEKCLWMSLSQGTIQLAGALATKKFNTRLTSLDEIKCKTLTNHDPLAAIISRRPWRQANDSTRPLWPLWAWKANIWKLSAIKQWKWPKRIVSQQASRCHQSTLKKKKKKSPTPTNGKHSVGSTLCKWRPFFPWKKSSDISTLKPLEQGNFCFILKNAPADNVSQPEGSLSFFLFWKRLEFCCCVFITGRSTKDGHQIETSTAKMRRTDSARYAPQPGAPLFSLGFLSTSSQIYMFYPLPCASFKLQMCCQFF